MKIASLELFPVPPRWLFLKVTTDEGLAGWGEPVVEGRAATVKTAVEELLGYLIGKDPFRIEDHFQVMYRSGFYRGGPVLTSALSGVEQALWDIKGKALGVPVYELLGGARAGGVGDDRREDERHGGVALHRLAHQGRGRGGATGRGARGGRARLRHRRRLPRSGPQEHGQGPDARDGALPPALHRGAGAAREQRGVAGAGAPYHRADRSRRADAHPLGLQGRA